MLLRFAGSIAFAAATLGGAFFGTAPAGAASDAALKIAEPVLHENLAIYLVRGPSTPGAVPTTLEEALLKNTIIVHETGSVSELQIENTGDEPVFIQFGDIVKGGRQDRVLTTSFLIPPKSGKVAIGAYCVEQGRWSKRGLEDAAPARQAGMDLTHTRHCASRTAPDQGLLRIEDEADAHQLHPLRLQRDDPLVAHHRLVADAHHQGAGVEGHATGECVLGIEREGP